MALAALNQQATRGELGSRFAVHPTQIAQWKKQLIDNAASVFERGGAGANVDQEQLIADLYEQLGRVHAELEWFKKVRSVDRDARRLWIDPDHRDLSVVRRCELAELSRATYYREPARESEENLCLMRKLDEASTRCPFYGSRKFAELLGVNRKRVQRLMRIMGIEAIYAKR